MGRRGGFRKRKRVKGFHRVTVPIREKGSRMDSITSPVTDFPYSSDSSRANSVVEESAQIQHTTPLMEDEYLKIAMNNLKEDYYSNHQPPPPGTEDENINNDTYDFINDKTPSASSSSSSSRGVYQKRESESSSGGGGTYLEFRVILLGTCPVVWRRFAILSSSNMFDLHVAIQDTMGYTDRHSHNFEIRQPESGIIHVLITAVPGHDNELWTPSDILIEEAHVVIQDYFNEKNNVGLYSYHANDVFEHQVIYEGPLTLPDKTCRCVCLDGENHCPVELTGSISVWKEVSNALKFPNTHNNDYCDRLQSLIDMCRSFNFNQFDPETVKFNDPYRRWKEKYGTARIKALDAEFDDFILQFCSDATRFRNRIGGPTASAIPPDDGIDDDDADAVDDEKNKMPKITSNGHIKNYKNDPSSSVLNGDTAAVSSSSNMNVVNNDRNRKKTNKFEALIASLNMESPNPNYGGKHNSIHNINSNSTNINISIRTVNDSKDVNNTAINIADNNNNNNNNFKRNADAGKRKMNAATSLNNTLPHTGLVYELKIVLKHSSPKIWRRIQVPSHSTFWDVHVAIQNAMQWTGMHSHFFEVFSTKLTMHVIGLGDDEYVWNRHKPLVAEEFTRITDYFTCDNLFAGYVYNLRAFWDFHIMLDAILPAEANTCYPICVAGRRSSPPENYGGIIRYEHCLNIARDSTTTTIHRGDPPSSNVVFADELSTLTALLIGEGKLKDRFDRTKITFSDPKQCWRRMCQAEKDMEDQASFIFDELPDHHQQQQHHKRIATATSVATSCGAIVDGGGGVGGANKKESDTIYQLKISVVNFRRMWRRIHIKAKSNFNDLHSAILNAVGWTENNAGLHSFEIFNPKTGCMDLIIPAAKNEPLYFPRTIKTRPYVEEMTKLYNMFTVTNRVAWYEFYDTTSSALWRCKICYEKSFQMLKAKLVFQSFCVGGRGSFPPLPPWFEEEHGTTEDVDIVSTTDDDDVNKTSSDHVQDLITGKVVATNNEEAEKNSVPINSSDFLSNFIVPAASGNNNNNNNNNSNNNSINNNINVIDVVATTTITPFSCSTVTTSAVINFITSTTTTSIFTTTAAKIYPNDTTTTTTAINNNNNSDNQDVNVYYCQPSDRKCIRLSRPCETPPDHQHFVYQLKIAILGIKPEIWRRILVPYNCTFWQLHIAIQDAMGWNDRYPHQFEVSSSLTTNNSTHLITLNDCVFDTFANNRMAEEKTFLTRYFLQQNDSAVYIYDPGNQWEHAIFVEDMYVPPDHHPLQQDNSSDSSSSSSSSSDSSNSDCWWMSPVCLDGKMACPPEDCGGRKGYVQLVSLVNDPDNRHRNVYEKWLYDRENRPFSTSHFQLSEVTFTDPEVRWKYRCCYKKQKTNSQENRKNEKN